MKLHRKLAKLARRETYRRGWRRAQRSVFRLPLGPVLAGLDQNRLAEIQKCYAGEKYADVDQWLRVNRERVQDLKLHRSPPQRVLDLGCGGGFFLFILKRLLALIKTGSPKSKNVTPARNMPMSINGYALIVSESKI